MKRTVAAGIILVIISIIGIASLILLAAIPVPPPPVDPYGGVFFAGPPLPTIPLSIFTVSTIAILMTLGIAMIVKGNRHVGYEKETDNNLPEEVFQQNMSS